MLVYVFKASCSVISSLCFVSFFRVLFSSLQVLLLSLSLSLCLARFAQSGLCCCHGKCVCMCFLLFYLFRCLLIYGVSLLRPLRLALYLPSGRSLPPVSFTGSRFSTLCSRSWELVYPRATTHCRRRYIYISFLLASLAPSLSMYLGPFQ